MASASSSSARNLFQDSKIRLSDRVQVNVNNVGSLAKQMSRGSKSNEIMAQTIRQFCQTETVIDNSFNVLQKTQMTLAHLNLQERSIRADVDRLSEVQEQIRDMQR